MKRYRLTTLAASMFCITASLQSVGFAQTMSAQQIQALVDKLVNQKTAHLQNEVKNLRMQVVSLRAQLKPNSTKSTKPRAAIHEVATVKNVPKTGRSTTSEQFRMNRRQDRGTAHAIEVNNTLTGLYLGGSPVFTSPYIGEHSAFDGSNLIVNQSTVNFDVQLLKQEQALEDSLTEKKLPLPNHPLVELSGEVAGLANSRETNPGNNQSDINLSDAELDVYAQMNPWVLGFAEFSWEDSIVTPYRVARSNAYIDKAFITVGNLNKTPLYGSIGQLYVPFGQYSTYMISDELPRLLARTQARADCIRLSAERWQWCFCSRICFQK